MPTQKSRPGAGTAYATTQSHDSPIDKVLHGLGGVKRTGPGKWIARCPAHDDRRPSLSIREAEDHKVLLKCWSGCGAAEIVNALGLSLSDLFPQDRRNLSEHSTGPTRRPWEFKDALQGIAHEATVARLILEDARNGRPLDAETLDRLALAEERISDAARIAGGVQ
jgi:DNA primase